MSAIHNLQQLEDLKYLCENFRKCIQSAFSEGDEGMGSRRMLNKKNCISDKTIGNEEVILKHVRNLEHLDKRFRQIQRNIERNKIKINIIGSASVGKRTLVDSLIGENIFTSSLDYITSGLMCGMDDHEYKPVSNKEEKRIEQSNALENCRKRKITKRLGDQNCDISLTVLSNALTDDDKSLLQQQLQNSSRRDGFILINKWDLSDDDKPTKRRKRKTMIEDECITFFKDHCGTNLSEAKNRIFFISAKEMLDIQRDETDVRTLDPHTKERYDSYMRFERSIEKHLSNSVAYKRRRYQSELKGIIDLFDVEMKEFNSTVHMLMKRNEIKEKFDKFIEEFEQFKNEFSTSFDRRKSQTLKDISQFDMIQTEKGMHSMSKELTEKCGDFMFIKMRKIVDSVKGKDDNARNLKEIEKNAGETLKDSVSSLDDAPCCLKELYGNVKDKKVGFEMDISKIFSLWMRNKNEIITQATANAELNETQKQIMNCVNIAVNTVGREPKLNFPNEIILSLEREFLCEGVKRSILLMRLQKLFLYCVCNALRDGRVAAKQIPNVQLEKYFKDGIQPDDYRLPTAIILCHGQHNPALVDLVVQYLTNVKHNMERSNLQTFWGFSADVVDEAVQKILKA